MVEAKLNKWYPIQMWILSLVLASFMLFIYSVAGSNFSDVSFDIYAFFFFILISFFYSCPVALVCYIVFRVSASKFKQQVIIKSIVAAMAITGMLITVLAMLDIDAFTEEEGYSGLLLAVSFTISIILSSSIFRVYKKGKEG